MVEAWRGYTPPPEDPVFRPHRWDHWRVRFAVAGGFAAIVLAFVAFVVGWDFAGDQLVSAGVVLWVAGAIIWAIPPWNDPEEDR